MKIEKKLDSGPFIKQISVKINKETTSGELSKKLSILGAEALKESIELISSSKVIFKQQNEKNATLILRLMERSIIHRLATCILAICNDKRKALKVEGTGLLNFRLPRQPSVLDFIPLVNWINSP
jgi:hypothetical protein